MDLLERKSAGDLKGHIQDLGQ
jgi:hypothetical protein